MIRQNSKKRQMMIIMEENKNSRTTQKEMAALSWGSWQALPTDEYECMKMKRLSQYRDSAGTQVTG